MTNDASQTTVVRDDARETMGDDIERLVDDSSHEFLARRDVVDETHDAAGAPHARLGVARLLKGDAIVFASHEVVNGAEIAGFFGFDGAHFFGDSVLVHALVILHGGHDEGGLIFVGGDESVFNAG